MTQSTRIEDPAAEVPDESEHVVDDGQVEDLTTAPVDSTRLRFSRSTLSTVGLLTVSAFCAARIAAVDVGGIVTNDSVGYLRRAESPFGAGFVFQGYRQVGYPVSIWFSNLVGDTLGWDQIFGIALLQRSLLVLGLGLLVWYLRWWSVPVLLWATSATFVLQADFVLAEGLLIPFCLISAALLGAVVVGRVETRFGARLILTSSIVLAVLSASLKMQYASLLTLGGALAWLLVRDRLCTRRFALVALTAGLAFVGSLALAQSVENQSDLGTFEPIAERHRSMWWGAWQAVFAHQPENRASPALAEFYANGNLYTFLHGIEASVPDYDERRMLTEDRVHRMFEAAGTSADVQRIESFLGALRGGRSDDLSGITTRVLVADDGDPIARISFSAPFRDGGATAIIEGLNGGLRPGIMTTGPVLDFSQRAAGSHRPWSSVASVVSIALMCAGLLVAGRHRAASLAILAMFLAVAGAMASGFTDNARYLLGPLTIVLVGGTLAARGLVLSPRGVAILSGSRSRTSGGWPGSTDAEDHQASEPSNSERGSLDHE